MMFGVLVLLVEMKRRLPRTNPFIKQICDLASTPYITRCAYCGMPASDREHVLPKAYRKNNDTVPSCRECNLMAGSKVFGSFAEKRDYIRFRIEIRYEGLAKTPHWTEDEIDELSGHLKSAIQMAMKAKEIHKDRMKWLYGKGMIG